MSGVPLLILTILSAPATEGVQPAPTASSAELAQRAEEAFREGIARRETADAARTYFRQAASLFEELRRRGASNALLYRNLGNAQLLAGDLPAAILSYRRGLRLSPADRELRANLTAAREQVVYSSSSALGRQPVDHRPPWLPHFQINWLFAGAVIMYGAAWVFLTRWLMARRRGQLLLGASLFLGAGILTALLLGDLNGDSNRPLVVIAEDGVLLRKGNSLAFPPRFDTPFNRGVEARLLLQRDDWLQIELAWGEVGWAPRNAVLVDE